MKYNFEHKNLEKKFFIVARTSQNFIETLHWTKFYNTDAEIQEHL